MTDQEEEHIQHPSIPVQQQQQTASSKTIVVKNYDTRTQVRLGCREHHRWDTIDAMLRFSTSSVWPSRVDAMLRFGGVHGDPVIIPVMTLKRLKASSITPPTRSNASLFFLFLFSSFFRLFHFPTHTNTDTHTNTHINTTPTHYCSPYHDKL